MRAVVSVVKDASVSVDGTVISSIGRGLLILLGITHSDSISTAEKLADKICSLRIFEDENGKINRSLEDAAGEVLVVSQFTLYGSCRRGRRPEFLSAAKGAAAEPIYEAFAKRCAALGHVTKTGTFGAYMLVKSTNDGPMTLMLDTEDL